MELMFVLIMLCWLVEELPALRTAQPFLLSSQAGYMVSLNKPSEILVVVVTFLVTFIIRLTDQSESGDIGVLGNTSKH